MQLSVRELIGTARERFTSRDYYGALLCLEDLDGSARSYADVHHLRGLCLVMLERPDEALVEFDHALELNPRYVEAHLHRGLLLNNRGEQEAAAGAFASAAASERSPVAGVSGTVAARLANEHARLGDLYSEAGLSAEAIGQYKRAVELGPEFHDLRMRLARLLMEGGNPLAAIENLEMVVAARSEFHEARVQLGLARYMAGDVAGARKTWQACLAARPDLERVNAYLSMADRIPD